MQHVRYKEGSLDLWYENFLLIAVFKAPINC